jgi:hypothetical protein
MTIRNNPWLTGLVVLLSHSIMAQGEQDSTKVVPGGAAASDPTQLFTRFEFFNELQHLQNGAWLNVTTSRVVLKMGKRFTTRLDIPFVHNSTVTPDSYRQFGLGDISFRVLGYRILNSRKAASLASVEIALNTAQSPLLGTGKNIIIPTFAYALKLKEKKTILVLVAQQYKSVSGDPERANLNFSKLQVVLIHLWSRKVWTVLTDESYLDYIRGGASMNLECLVGYMAAKQTNLWAKGGVGLFGDHPARYQSTTEIGCRIFLRR